MTSKKVINKLKHCGVEEVRLTMEQIEKDLEVLEILKNNKNLLVHLIKQELFNTCNSYCGNTKEEREKINNYRNSLIKIKELLENEDIDK